MRSHHHLIGLIALSETRMGLTGKISVNGSLVEAICSTCIPKNMLVKVVGTSFHMLKVVPVSERFVRFSI